MSNFFALMARMKYINRWALMRNAHEENLSEHSLDVAITAHALVLLHNQTAAQPLSAERAAVLALFHDAPEILTGDMPTPVKYQNEALETAYKAAERAAKDRLFSTLPDELKAGYEDAIYFEERHPELYRYVKAADKLSAYLKCLSETGAGNREFSRAEEATRRTLDRMAEEMEELGWFMEHVLPSYSATLDEL